MKLLSQIGFILSLLLMAPISYSHPVSFEGSKGVMGHHSPEFSHVQLNYSYRFWGAIGVHHFKRNQMKNRHATVGSANFLFKRWNGEDFQGNLYGLIGAGQSELLGVDESVGYGGLQFDIEDRKYYFLAKSSILQNNDSKEYSETKLRFGVAPYIANFEGIHSWLILDYSHSEFNGENASDELTPALRIFHQNLLFEIGQSFSGQTKFNYIVHF